MSNCESNHTEILDTIPNPLDNKKKDPTHGRKDYTFTKEPFTFMMGVERKSCCRRK